MINDILEPVYVKNKDTLDEKWLKVTEKDVFEKNRSIKEIVKTPEWPIKEKVFKLLPTSLFKCVRCGATGQSDKKPLECPECQKCTNFEVVTENIDVQKNLWKIPTWEDIDVDMLEVYDDLLALLKRTIRFTEPIHYKIFALWITATYKHPAWETVPYLHLKGLPASGKTRAMEMVRLLAYRSVLVSGITFTAIVRINHNFNATLLIDEVDSKLDERTETGRDFVAFLKPGYKKGQLYIASDLNDQKKVVYYNNYGFKILSGEKGIYSMALLSRSLTFDMEQDFPEVYDLSGINKECEQLKTKLLNYRFKTNMPDVLSQEIPLKARSREIFDCLIRTAQHIGQPIDDLLEYAKVIEETAINDMQGTVEWDVLNILSEFSCQGTLDAREGVKISEILEELGWTNDPKKSRQMSQKLGYILKNLGLVTKKKRDGMWFLFVDPRNERKMKYLFRRYKIKNVEGNVNDQCIL